MTRREWYVTFYNLLGALANAVQKLFVAFSNVLPLRSVTHLSYSFQGGQVSLREMTYRSFGT